MVWIGAAFGFVTAALVWMLVQSMKSPEALQDWGWGLTFLSSILVNVAAHIIRRTMKESPVFKEVNEEAREQAATPLRGVLRTGRRPLLPGRLINIGSNGLTPEGARLFGDPSPAVLARCQLTSRLVEHGREPRGWIGLFVACFETFVVGAGKNVVGHVLGERSDIE